MIPICYQTLEVHAKLYQLFMWLISQMHHRLFTRLKASWFYFPTFFSASKHSTKKAYERWWTLVGMKLFSFVDERSLRKTSSAKINKSVFHINLWNDYYEVARWSLQIVCTVEYFLRLKIPENSLKVWEHLVEKIFLSEKSGSVQHNINKARKNFSLSNFPKSQVAQS